MLFCELLRMFVYTFSNFILIIYSKIFLSGHFSIVDVFFWNSVMCSHFIIPPNTAVIKKSGISDNLVSVRYSEVHCIHIIILAVVVIYSSSYKVSPTTFLKSLKFDVTAAWSQTFNKNTQIIILFPVKSNQLNSNQCNYYRALLQ